MFCLPFKPRSARAFLFYAAYALVLAVALSSLVAASKSDSSGGVAGVLSKSDKQAEAEKRRQTRRMYSLFDHIIRICVYTLLSAIFAGLTLGVMCADTFTLEIIAESGPAPDCKYAAQVLPLRRQGHKTLCTLIISNMLCNVLIVQEFSSVFDIIYAIRTHGNTNNVVDDSGSQLLNFIVSTTMIVLFAEILPMAICKSKHSLMVAAAGSIFVRVAMVVTYPVSAPLGKFLDWVVGTEETGQVYDRNELRRLMVVHYDQEGGETTMPKSELNLLLAAMDFQERKVRDIMTPIESATCVSENDVITPDFVERLWFSGRSRVPVESAVDGHFCDVLVVKDLLTINIGPDEDPLTVAQVVKARNRLFAMVGETTTLPAMMKFFQDAKTHMAVVFAEDEHDEDGEEDAGHSGQRHSESNRSGGADWPATARRSFALAHTTTMQAMRTVGIVTMEDVVEELLNDEIYDEYDRYEPEQQDSKASSTTSAKLPPRTPNGDPCSEEVHVPTEPTKPPRVNFYSYFTHPEQNTPLTDAQVWAVAYFLNRTVRSFVLWPPGYIKMLLDDCGDEQLVAPVAGPRSGSTVDSVALAATGTNSNNLEHSHNDTTSLHTGASSSEVLPAIDLRSEHNLEGSVATSAAIAAGAAGAVDSPTMQRHARRYDHAHFLSQAAEDRFVLYTQGAPSEFFTLVLGGQVDMLVGSEKFYSRLRSFQYVGEEALTQSFYAPDFSAIVSRAARVYRISKEKYEKYLFHQTMRQRLRSHLRVLRAPQSTLGYKGVDVAALITGDGRAVRSLSRGRGRGGQGGGRGPRQDASPTSERDSLLPYRPFSETALDAAASPSNRFYGTFKQDKY